MTPAHLDEAWQHIDEAMAIAERLADPDVLGRVLTLKGYCQRMCCEYEAAAATARQALPLVRSESLWDRAALARWPVERRTTSWAASRPVMSGCPNSKPRPAAPATTARSGGASSLSDTIEMARTGDLRKALKHARRMLERPQFWYVNRALHGLISAVSRRGGRGARRAGRAWSRNNRRTTSTRACRRPRCSRPRRSPDSTSARGR